MSFKIDSFLGQLVKKDLPDLAMKNPYFGAGIIAGGIEFLGNCLDTHPIESERKSTARFCHALNELFPSNYHQFSRTYPYSKEQKPTHDLYSCLRCGMAHVLRPQGVVLTGSIKEATEDGNAHLQILTRDGTDFPLIVVEQFAADFIKAVDRLEKRLAASGIPTKLQGDILTVWDS